MSVFIQCTIEYKLSLTISTLECCHSKELSTLSPDYSMNKSSPVGAHNVLADQFPLLQTCKTSIAIHHFSATQKKDLFDPIGGL